MDTLTPDTIQKIVDAFSAHVSSDAFVIPADVTATRLGPEPPDSFPLLRDRLENSILSLHGIPPASGCRTRNRHGFEGGNEAGWLHSLIRPLGDIVVSELREKMRPRRRDRLLAALTIRRYYRHGPRIRFVD